MNFYHLFFILVSLIITVNCVSRKPDEGPSNRYTSRLSSPPASPPRSRSASPDRDRSRSPRSRERSPRYSDYSATDSNDSFTGKELAPGTEQYHKKMHHLYNRKASFHNEIFKGSIRREPNFAMEHDEEMNSADRRHRLHGRIKKRIASGKLKPGIRTATPDPFPKEPNSRRVDNLRKSRQIIWRQKKGFKRLLPERLPEGQRRKRRVGEPTNPSSPSSSDGESSSSAPPTPPSSDSDPGTFTRFPSPGNSDGSPKGAESPGSPVSGPSISSLSHSHYTPSGSDDSRRSRSKSMSNASSASPSDLSATESENSSPGRTIAPGNAQYHEKMHPYYDKKSAFHKTTHDYYKADGKERRLTDLHNDEATSSYKKARKHEVWEGKVKSGEMQPGRKTAKDVPSVEISPPCCQSSAHFMRKNKNYEWPYKKNSRRLLPVKVSKKRSKRLGESSASGGTSDYGTESSSGASPSPSPSKRQKKQ
ncbi:uncharacterized protein FA14DRAFT_178858 [Meira miltonrushii]|uniref:Pal1-domain-containing protein n=1 Tax=Meira miltonrushii TaxID=1280837 RepID=A0A316VCX4_9BASI|nr:uncharacterized protein FA14DRAFT_178858 [Meira miltonrushii]PWN35489.1 hypothetical protein FA14DRAFT_178858 [Meira miltonrushii]